MLTPAAIGREALRVVKAHQSLSMGDALAPSLRGAVLAFVAGLFALKWLSAWLENGRWYVFGIYCVLAAVVVFFLKTVGY
jgi:undecaprenyl-diphosphatase